MGCIISEKETSESLISKIIILFSLQYYCVPFQKTWKEGDLCFEKKDIKLTKVLNSVLITQVSQFQ